MHWFLPPVSHAGANLFCQTWLSQAGISKQVKQVQEIYENKWFKEKEAVNSRAIAEETGRSDSPGSLGLVGLRDSMEEWQEWAEKPGVSAHC